MKIMAVNAGSSSLKFQLLDMPKETKLVSGVVERIGLQDSIFSMKFNGETHKEIKNIKNHSQAVQMLLSKLVSLHIVSSLDEIQGVGHRVVHGGEMFHDSVIIDDEVIASIESVNDLAPLHNPANITGIKAFKEALPNVPAIAVFDTAFHQTMEPVAYMYSVPYEWYTKYGVRKYGFHGTSHKYVSLRAAAMLDKPLNQTKVIVCHIGNGASLCAVKYGKSMDTSMGFTPLAGIAMGTRSGDIDPAIVQFISEKENKSLDEVISELNKKSGYLGLSGLSSDSRDLWEAVERGDKKSILAVEKQAKMIADYIGAYYLMLGGCDAICFTAGIGENASETRKLVVDRLGALGVELDYEQNLTRGKETVISKPSSNIKLLLIPTNEEVMIARDTLELIG
ncbi:acetate kinase [Candidatus Xianfuyuplasma coldseepsis]|uniref:Acetate kinase n=1 Tax=Candidatus Xianfuyuplasma coldseepsis TaxID=2782163 RepID=A0A7L7KS35_9MOLU|nr:acetate kinase [Xianfuyuplasma coldseepsis]QMS84764.1 acetate kinase [Xianfuyuplasma coldseepsis]